MIKELDIFVMLLSITSGAVVCVVISLGMLGAVLKDISDTLRDLVDLLRERRDWKP